MQRKTHLIGRMHKTGSLNCISENALIAVQPCRKQRRNYRTITSATAFVLLLAAIVATTTGCDAVPTEVFVPEPAGLTILDDNFDKMPNVGAEVDSVLPASLGPAGSLFGLLMEDQTQAFVLGSTDADGNVTITGVVLMDENGDLILQQDIKPTGTKLTFASGDAVDLDAASGSDMHFEMTLNATSPPSVIVADYDEAANTLTLDTSNTRLETGALNPNYHQGNARLRIADTSEHLKPHKGQSSKDMCATVGDGIVLAIGAACDIKSFVTSKAPEAVITAMTILVQRTLDEGIKRQTPGSMQHRILVAAKTSATVACEGLKEAAELGSLFTKLNPFDAACMALTMADDGISAVTGESLAQQICKLFTTDQNLGGLLTSAASIQLSLLDIGVDDGDLVELKHNGRTIYNGVVSTTAKTLDVNLDPGLNHFEFVALNEGDISPNTAQVSVLGITGADLGNTVFNLTMGQVATLDIVRSS